MKNVSSRTPRFVRIGAVIGAVFLALPIVGLLKRVAWSTLWGQLTDVATRDALRISLYASVCATLLALVLGLPLAWCLARMQFAGRRFVRALVLLPMVLPPVVGGVALLGAYGKTSGLLGGVLDSLFGIQLTYSLWGVIIAETFVADALLGPAPSYQQATASTVYELNKLWKRYMDAASWMQPGEPERCFLESIFQDPCPTLNGT